MSVDAVLVSFSVEGHYRTYETSGTLLAPDLVLLTGTALLPLVQRENWISLFLNSCSSKLEPNAHIRRIRFRVYSEGRSGRLAPVRGTAVGAWRCPVVGRAARELLWGWRVGHVSLGERDVGGEVMEVWRGLMSVFVVVRCGGGSEGVGREDWGVLRGLLGGLGGARRGEEVEVVSTPFGHRDFMNSVSRGVVSAVVGEGKCIVLSDVRTVSGCEGGPIFAVKKIRKEREKGELVGIVTCPLTWWRGEWVGLTMGVSLLPVFNELLRPGESLAASVGTAPEGSGSDSLPFKFIDDSVVLVRSMDSWGSGVVLDGASGTVLTCSHVVKNDATVSVFHMGNQWSADVVFRSKSDVAYDLAVLKIRQSYGFAKGVRFPGKPAELGEAVIAAGFPFFSEKDDVCLRPSIVTGCISRVNPYMIQTTCCIQSGFSGGPLFRDGELLGIIISNTTGSGALFPHINFVAPSSVFKEPVLRYIRTNDIQSLQELESSNSEVQSVWKLNTSKL